MKRTVLCFLLYLFSETAFGQYVNIPDPNFVSFLQAHYPSCMSGAFLDTTCSAIINEWSLSCPGGNIYDLTGIQYFDNLQGLDCSQNNLSFLPPLPNALQSLDCEENNLSSLPALPASLQQLSCWGNNISYLPTPLPNLTFLNCSFNPLYTLPPLPATITTLACAANNLTTISNLPPNIVWLECWQNNLTQLPPLPATMSNLYIQSNPISCLPPISSIGDFEWSNTNILCIPNPITVTTANPSIISMPQCDSTSGCPFVCNIPSSQARSITFSNVTSTSVTVHWTNGNGSRRIVKIKPTNAFTAPVNGNDYTANSVYSGSGEQVVYNGTGSSVTVTGLGSSIFYWFRVYEVSCTSSNSLYYTSTAIHNPRRVMTLPYYNPNRPEGEVNEEENNSIQVYPNPTSSSITLESGNNNLIQSINLYSMEGRLVKSLVVGRSSLVEVDLKELSAGIYFLDCVGENGSEKVKVVKY
jgi:hypothetical protein